MYDWNWRGAEDAQEVARLKRRNVESAYLCGLLHRIGMAVILSRVGSAVVKHGISPEPGQVLQLAARHEARVGTHLAIAWSLPPSVAAAITHWRDPRSAELARTEVMEVALARQIVPAFEQQHSLAGRRKSVGERAAACPRTDHDHVVMLIVGHSDPLGSSSTLPPSSARRSDAPPTMDDVRRSGSRPAPWTWRSMG